MFAIFQASQPSELGASVQFFCKAEGTKTLRLVSAEELIWYDGNISP